MRECPLCGARVSVPEGDLLIAGPKVPDSDRRAASSGVPDRLAAALCGCYVFRMDDAAIGRLMARILAADADSDPTV